MVRQILDSDGNVKQTISPTLVRETVSASTSEFIKDALLATVDEGTGTAAAIAGYEFAGKTGTAQKYPREAEKYLISFAGFLPYDNPEILIYVVIDEPNVEDQSTGGYGTALTKEIMEALIPYLNLHPTREIPVTENPGGERTPEGSGMPEDAGAPEEGGNGEPPEVGEPAAPVENGNIYPEGSDNSVYEALRQQGSGGSSGPAVDD